MTIRVPKTQFLVSNQKLCFWLSDCHIKTDFLFKTLGGGYNLRAAYAGACTVGCLECTCTPCFLRIIYKFLPKFYFFALILSIMHCLCFLEVCLAHFRTGAWRPLLKIDCYDYHDNLGCLECTPCFL